MFNTPNYSYPWNTGGYPYTQNYNTSQPQQNSNGINWVQGEAGAKSYAVAPGQSVLLMDSDENVFYIKSADQSGMPMPLKIYDYKERIVTPKIEQNVPQTADYITREEFEKRLAEIADGKQRVSTDEW